MEQIAAAYQKITVIMRIIFLIQHIIIVIENARVMAHMKGKRPCTQ